MAAKATQQPNAIIAAQAASMMIESTDIEIPRLNIIQKTSEIDAPFGSVVLDKQYVIAEPEEKIRCIPVSVMKAWREDIPFDEDVSARIAYTKEERDEIGKDSKWNMLEFADLILMFFKPDDTDSEDAYPFVVGDKQYALGKINVAKDGYRQTFKRLATFSLLNPDVPLPSRVWTLSSSIIQRGKYSWYAPGLSITSEETPEEVQKFTANFLT